MSIFDCLWRDPKIEGKKQGYQKGVEVYRGLYEELKKMYAEEEKILRKTKREYEVYNEQLIDYKEKLEKIIRDLEIKIHKKYKGRIDLTGNVLCGCVGTGLSGIISIGMYRKGLIEGYNQAKELYERKIESLIRNKSNLIAKSKRDLGQYNSLKDDILRDIYKDLEKIAEYQVLLSGGES